jgi:hypothetical protein
MDRLIKEFRVVMRDRLLDISDKYGTYSSIRISEKTENSFKCQVVFHKNGVVFLGDLEFITDVLECYRFCSDYFQLNMNLYDMKNHQVLRGWREHGTGINFHFILTKRV